MPPSSSSSTSPAGRAAAQTSASTSAGTDASFTRAADVSSHHSEGEGDPEVKESSDSVGEAEEAAVAAASSASRVHLSTAHLGAGSHVAFNPFLIPGMSHGLLYPHMFLPHGGIMALPAMPPGAVEVPHATKRRKNRVQEVWERKEEKVASVEERESTVEGAASFSTSSTPPPKPEELQAQQVQRRDCPSGGHQPGSGAEEAEQRQEDSAEKVEQDSEGQEEDT